MPSAPILTDAQRDQFAALGTRLRVAMRACKQSQAVIDEEAAKLTARLLKGCAEGRGADQMLLDVGDIVQGWEATAKGHAARRWWQRASWVE